MRQSSFWGTVCSILLVVPVTQGQGDASNVTPYRTFTGYTDPAPAGFSPVSISSEEATTEVAVSSATAGFESAYFSASEITDLTSNSSAVGVRFYNATEGEGAPVSVIAVGVKADGSEINSAFSKKYYQSQPVGTEIRSKKISTGNARDYVTNASNSPELQANSVFFSKSSLNTMVSQLGSIGLKVIPGYRNWQTEGGEQTVGNTLMLIGVNASMSDMGGSYQKSLEPCPTVCPNETSYTLNP